MVPARSSAQTEPMREPATRIPNEASLFDRLTATCAEHGLIVMGALHPDATPTEASGGTLVLLGCGADFWPVFTASAEAQDGGPDPIDRFSTRVVSRLADRFGATARFPFGGPPFAPFISWALHSNRAHTSPIGMLVHDTVGLMISYRGALCFSAKHPLPPATGASPCLGCADRPCTTACPVSALSDTQPYDIAACHAYLDTAAGEACMKNGCAARRACPVSAGANRTAEQSALHMKAFHPK